MLYRNVLLDAWLVIPGLPACNSLIMTQRHLGASLKATNHQSYINAIISAMGTILYSECHICIKWHFFSLDNQLLLLLKCLNLKSGIFTLNSRQCSYWYTKVKNLKWWVDHLKRWKKSKSQSLNFVVSGVWWMTILRKLDSRGKFKSNYTTSWRPI